MPSVLSRCLNEVGLPHVLASPRDVKLLLVQRLVRMSAYGATAFILVLYLVSLGFPEPRIGLFFTLTLVGDCFISFILSLFADGFGRKKVLIIGAILMALSGVVFALSTNFWILLLASIVGVISPSGSDYGPFRAVEDSIFAQLTPEDYRSDIFAWSNLIGGIGIASGQFICGGVLQLLKDKANWELGRSYRAVFVVYAVLGVVKLLISASLTGTCEAVKKGPVPSTPEIHTALDPTSAEDTDASQPLLGDQNHVQKEPRRLGIKSLLPSFSAQSTKTLIKLCLLFVLDSFASGMVGPSWIAFFFVQKFEVDFSILGSIFSICFVVSALSNLFSVPTARRIGLVPAMVFAHLWSSIFLALIPAPNDLVLAALFLTLRHGTGQMDVAPKQAFIVGAVLPSERTAAMGVINVARILSQSPGPSVTGILAGKSKLGVVFVIAGCLKVVYDFLMLALFWRHKGRKEEEEEDGDETADSRPPTDATPN